MARLFDDNSQSIGGTPLVLLNRIAKNEDDDSQEIKEVRSLKIFI